MKLTGWKINLLLGWTGMATGCSFLLLAVGFAAYEAFFLVHSSKTQGIITANLQRETPADTQNGTPAQTNYCSQFRYQSTDGVTHLVTSSACLNRPSFMIGEQVGVRYANWNYDDGQTDSFGARWGFVLGFGLAALVLMPIGFVLLRRVWLQSRSLDPIGYWDPN